MSFQGKESDLRVFQSVTNESVSNRKTMETDFRVLKYWLFCAQNFFCIDFRYFSLSLSLTLLQTVYIYVSVQWARLRVS